MGTRSLLSKTAQKGGGSIGGWLRGLFGAEKTAPEEPALDDFEVSKTPPQRERSNKVAPLAEQGSDLSSSQNVVQHQHDDLMKLKGEDEENLKKQTILALENTAKESTWRKSLEEADKNGVDVEMPEYDESYDPKTEQLLLRAALAAAGGGDLGATSGRADFSVRRLSLMGRRRSSASQLTTGGFNPTKNYRIFSDYIRMQTANGTIAQFADSVNKTLIFAVGKARINCTPSLAKAWLCDDEFKEGIRKDAPRKDGVQRMIVRRLNDHAHVDYRCIKQWPLVPRDFLLRHVSVEVPKKKKPESQSPNSRTRRELRRASNGRSATMRKSHSGRRGSGKSAERSVGAASLMMRRKKEKLSLTASSRRSSGSELQDEIDIDMERERQEQLDNANNSVFMRIFTDYIDEEEYVEASERS